MLRLFRATRVRRPFSRSLATFKNNPTIAKHLFESFAQDTPQGEAELNPNNLRALLKSLGILVSRGKLDSLIQKADLNGDGNIQMNEFMAAYEWLLEQEQDEEELRVLFNMLDGDRNGYLEVTELLGLLSVTKHKLTVDEARDIIRSANQGSNEDRIDFETFKTFLASNPDLGSKLLCTFRVIFVTGGPGSGKGTICSQLIKKTPVVIQHISSGDLLRHEVISGSTLGNKIAEIMAAGQLCDGSLVVALLEKALRDAAGSTVLLDGFPRSIENAQSFYELFGTGECMLYFDCPDAEMTRRILERGKLSGRLDDNVETAAKRITTFHAQSKAPMAYLASKGTKIVRVDSLQPIESNVDFLLSLPIFKPGWKGQQKDI